MLSGSVLVRVEAAWYAVEAALTGAMIVVLVLVLLELAWTVAEDDLKGAENMVRVGGTEVNRDIFVDTRLNIGLSANSVATGCRHQAAD